MKLNKGHFSSGNVIVHFWGKVHQEINVKSDLNSCYFVNKEKMLSD